MRRLNSCPLLFQKDPHLSGEMKRDGITIAVHIYRGKDEDTWVLEVVDSHKTSFLWDDRFPTDQDAMDELTRTIAKEGMKQFNPNQRKKLH
jgi:hypothetical protein